MEEARESGNLPNYSRRLEVHKAGRTFRFWAPEVNGGQETAQPWIPQLASLLAHPTNTQSFFFFPAKFLSNHNSNLFILAFPILSSDVSPYGALTGTKCCGETGACQFTRCLTAGRQKYLEGP